MNEYLEYAIRIVPIAFSFIALIISLKTYLAKTREEKPSFSIVQNLWTNSPYYELINEANSKLDSIPSPSYYMFIPSKVYFQFKMGQCYSVLTLSPVSYDVIEEQIVFGTTKSSIVKSKLPSNFSAKKGEREIIRSQTGQKDGLQMFVETYPFLVIISEIEYSYKHKRRKDILLSTPLETQKTNESMVKHIREYLHDNYHHEVLLPDGSSSIYVKVNAQVLQACKDLKTNSTFFGGKEGGYGFILKKISRLIIPIDPMEKYYQKEAKKGRTKRSKLKRGNACDQAQRK